MFTLEEIENIFGKGFAENKGICLNIFYKWMATGTLIVLQNRDDGQFNVLKATGKNPKWHYITMEPLKACRVAKRQLKKLENYALIKIGETGI